MASKVIFPAGDDSFYLKLGWVKATNTPSYRASNISTPASPKKPTGVKLFPCKWTKQNLMKLQF